jgi:6-phosphogluconolactonase
LRLKLRASLFRLASLVGALAVPSLAGPDIAEGPTGGSTLFYVGTYTGGESRGIYASWLGSDGRLAPPVLAVETVSPSFLALHASQPYLYAVNEVDTFEGAASGAVSAFRIEPESGRLTALNQVASRGGGPCHLAVDPTGKNVIVANYGGGSVAVLPIGKDGRLGNVSDFVQHRGSSANAERQAAPHAHAVELDAQGRFALVADLGLDRVFSYPFDATRGSLSASEAFSAPARPGAGPRHLAFHSSGRFVYAVNELHLTVTAFRYDAEHGRLEELQTLSTLPAGTAARPSDSGAEIAVHPSGRFLYVSNRGPDTLAVFALDPATGRLTPIETVPSGGQTPRQFAIDPTGHFLLAANQKSNGVTVFRINDATGRLSPTGQAISVGAPVCVAFRRPQH